MTRALFVANWDWVLAHFRLPLARRLREEDYNVVLCCPPGEYVIELRDAGFEWHPWDLQRRSMGVLGELRSLRDLARQVERNAPDVVHAFTIKPVVYLSLVVLWRSVVQRANRPRLLINNLTGLGYLFSAAPRARVVRAVLWPLLVVCLRQPRAQTVLMNDGDHQRLARMRLLGPRTQLIRGTGVNTACFTPAETSNRDGERARVLFAGRLLVSKGVADFVAAAQHLAKERDADFLVAGMPDSGNPETISSETVEGWHTSGAITWLGHVPNMGELLSAVDVVVLPSHSEGLPRILLEGAAAGCGLVASDIDGCREVIDHGRNGLLVPLGDPCALAEAIRDLLDDPDRRAMLGAAARRDAVGRFDLETINDQWVDLYRRSLEKQTP